MRSGFGFECNHKVLCLNAFRQRGIHHRRAAAGVRLEQSRRDWRAAVSREQPQLVNFVLGRGGKLLAKKIRLRLRRW